MTTTLRCVGLRKRYSGQDEYALGPDPEGISIEASRGELFALLGPSGCGKTTTLRIIGGFISSTAGMVEIDGRDLTGQRPYQRPTNTVFQGYALFPHMTVAANVAFGLKMERVKRPERDRRVAEALDLVGLGEFGKRRVSELSGGQAQRAALARAMVKEPSVLLLDEPLGALDLKLRRQMQLELHNLKERTGTTFVHVTHDQEEACAIADRIAVMSEGRVVQVDTPVGLFRSPRTAYVAEFINAGAVVRGSVKRSGDVIELERDGFVVRGTAPGWMNGSASAAAVLPPGALRLGADRSPGADGQSADGEVERIVFTGSAHEVHVRVSKSAVLRVGVELAEIEKLEHDGLAIGERTLVSWHPKDVMFVLDEDLAVT